MTEEEAQLFASFLSPMLNVWGTKRAQAKDMLNHSWLGGVVVQGELDCMERERSRSASNSLASAGRSQLLTAPSSTVKSQPSSFGSGNPISLPPKSSPSRAVPQKKTGFEIKSSENGKP